MYVRFASYIDLNKALVDKLGTWTRINNDGLYVFEVNDKKRFFLFVIEHGTEYKDLTEQVQWCIDNNTSYYGLYV